MNDVNGRGKEIDSGRKGGLLNYSFFFGFRRTFGVGAPALGRLFGWQAARGEAGLTELERRGGAYPRGFSRDSRPRGGKKHPR